MGKYEDQLKALGTSDAVFRIEGITALETQMGKLKEDMATLAADPGWTGASAEAAKELFISLQAEFADAEGKLNGVRSAIGTANGHRADAANAQASLPDASVPDWVHTAALIGGSVLIPVPGVGTFAAETVVQKVNEYMGLQREAAAYKELEELESKLVGPKQEIKSAPLAASFGGYDPDWPEPATSPEWPGEGVTYHGDDTGAGGWSTSGATSGGGGSSDVAHWELIGDPGPRDPEVIVYPPNPPIVLPPVRPPGWPNDFIKPPEISIDGDSGGGSNPGGILGGGGGLGLGLAGAGAAGIGAAKLASKSGLGGAGGLFGPNGLLGGGANGAGVAGGAGAAGTKGGVAGAAAGAGSKGGSAMMGGGQGGGSDEKNKRNSLGLMAPKLEDDEDFGPRGRAAGPGGRE